MKAKFWVTLQVEVIAEGASARECRANAAYSVRSVTSQQVSQAIARAASIGEAYPADVTELVEVIEK